MTRFLLFLFLLLPLKSLCDLNDLSKRIDRLNQKAFKLKNSNLTEADKTIIEAFNLLQEGDVESIIKSNTYSVSGTIEFQRGNFKKALERFLQSLSIREKTENTEKVADSYLNIANLYYKINRLDSSIVNYKRCLSYRMRSKGNQVKIIAAYNGLTQIFETEGQIDSALYYYDKAAKLVKGLSNKNYQSVSDLYCNLGQLHETNENYEQSLDYFNEALKIQETLNDQYGIAWTLHHLGIVNDNKRNSVKAKYYFHKSDSLATLNVDFEMQRDIAKSWMLLYTREKNTDSVNYYLDRFEALNDSINKEITDKQLYEAEVKYHTEKTKINLKNAEAQTATLGWFLGTGLFLAFIIFFYLIRTYRQKQRITNMEINLKNREINNLLVQQESSSYAAMLEGQDHERQRIARDLHDRLGSTLAAIRIGLEGAAAGEQSHNKQLVEIAMTEVRSIAHDLSAGNIENYGLNTALEELSYSIGKSGTITMNLYLDERAVLTNQMKIELYRIVQELISNTLKHANATEVTIQTHWHGSHFNLIYEDNGTGFDRSKHTAGMGHRNIAARLEKLEGSFEIDTQLNRGTIVIIDVPQKNEA